MSETSNSARRRPRWVVWILLALIAAAAIGAALWYQGRLEPMPAGAKRYIRWEKPGRIGVILADLQRRGVIRDANAVRIYAWLNKIPSQIQAGTYEVAPGMSVSTLLSELQKPVRQMVRLPETNWARRSSNLLEQKKVTTSAEYMELVGKPGEFKDVVSFPLPSDSLEGYLYPDTYDLPPLLGARAVIVRQLKNFERKVWEELDKPENLHDLVIKGSLVELEAGRDEERPIIAGVIENRVDKGMRLQIDASLLYGIQKWRRLTFNDYRTIEGPYNLYRVDGLPPGPICSPTIKSIRAAMSPAKHDYLYYVALPSGKSLFASTYDEHKRNIQKRIKALKEQEKQTR